MRVEHSVRWIVGCALCVVATGVGSRSGSVSAADPTPTRTQLAAGPQLMAGSPLAATATAVYAVSQDGREILTRPADLSGLWQTLEVRAKFGRIGGLAADRGSLFVTDSSDEAVYRVDLRSLERVSIYQEGPLDDPGSIAIARDVFVADNKTSKLFRIRDEKIAEIVLDKDVGKGGPLALAGAGDDLLVASPDGMISEFRGIGRSAPESMQSPRQQSAEIYKNFKLSESLVYSIQKRAFPEIRRPTNIAFWNGVVYLADQEHRSLFAFSRHDQRPVRLTYGQSRRVDPTSIAVTDEALYVLNGTTLERWARLIPVEVHLRLASLSESMALVYEYLHERKILPVRTVALDQNLENTLKKNGVILGGYSKRLTNLLCTLNARLLCDKAGVIKVMQPDDQISVPDLLSENYVDAEPVSLTGTESLGQVVDRRVRSDQFAHWRSEARLYELNESQLIRAKIASARDVRSGNYMTPAEYVRYLVPAIAGDASGDGALKRLESVFEGLRVVPLEERRSSQAAVPSIDLIQEPDLAKLKTAFDLMLTRIDYMAPTDSPVPIKVGVAEKFIDVSHPSLRDALLPTFPVAPAPAAAPSVTYRIRPFEPEDHGTMVAGLIGARATPKDHPGLAPKTLLLSVQSNDPPIGEEIKKAVLRGVKIFNVSAHYDINTVPPSLLQAINNYSNALFIVASGNDLVAGAANEVCGAFMVYPACWHDKKNVLVVTATSSGGDIVLPAADGLKGANWSKKAVHLAAPGEGYHAPAVGSSYAPARGSSFATPLVTATAALIFAQSPVEPDPVTIKDRLIATADPEPNLFDKIVGGRLNVRRALSSLGFGVVTRREADASGTLQTVVQQIVIDAGKITVQQSDGDERVIPVRKLRRVHKYGNGYRIVYVNGDAIDVLVDAQFEEDAHAKFDATTQDGKKVTVNLRQTLDFVAPLSKR